MTEFARKSLLVVTCLAFLLGCTAITDFDRFQPSGDDGGGIDAAPPRDAGPCEAPGEDEACNGDDDDCDGMIDEDFDLQTDPNNCGSCSATCAADIDHASAGCVDGSCEPSCDDGFGDCDGTYANGCEQPFEDPDHCAACGVACTADEVCTVTGCATECPDSANMICNRTCIDTETSVMHCGGCDNACADATNASAVCVAGGCDIECDTGWDDCDGDASNGCETDLTTVTDCGTCDTSCTYANGIPACTDGSCALTMCNDDFDDCDGDASNGCEADLGSLTTCGACTTSCTAPDHASATCDGVACGFTCDTGFADCDGDATNGCEADLASSATCAACTTSCTGATPLCSGGACVADCSAPTPDLCGGTVCTDLDTDPQNCGSCGTVCADPANASPTCSAGGSCGFTCDTGFEDCNGLASDGCERSIRTATDCGGCGVACDPAHGSGSCSTGTCTITSCDTGWANCSGGVTDGCETDITTPAACGSCTNSCSVTNGSAACVSSTCVIAGCSSGFDDCNSTYSDGCEEMLTTYYRDADGDLRGNPSGSMDYCAADVPSAGWVTNDLDCDDGDINTYTAAPARCESPAKDNDCDGDVDESYGVGNSCSCTSGSRPGMVECDSTMSSSCTYPSEICNDADDDCDGTIDNDFACRIGTTQTCSTACGFAGTQSCTSSCSWTTCLGPAETCNGADDDCDGTVDEGFAGTAEICNGLDEDCDGRVDEGLLGRLASQTWSNGTLWEKMDMAYNGVRGEIGVVYVGDSDRQFYFARFTADLSSMIAVENLGAVSGTSPRQPRVEALTDGDWFVSFYDPFSAALYYGFYDTAGVTWRTLSGPSPVYDVVADSGSAIARVWLIHGTTSAPLPTVMRAVTRSGGASVGVSGPNPFGSSLSHLAIYPYRGEFSVLYASESANGVEWRRVDTSGNTRAGPISVLPTGHTFTGLSERSIFTDVLEFGSSFATDRVGIFFHNNDSAGVRQFHFELRDGNGGSVWSNDMNRGTLSGAMEMSRTDRTMGFNQFDDMHRFTLSSGTSLGQFTGATFGSRNGIVAETHGGIRYYTVGQNHTISPDLEVAAYGCTP